MHPLKANPSAQIYLLKPVSTGQRRWPIEKTQTHSNSPLHVRRQNTFEDQTNPCRTPSRFLIHTKDDTKVVLFEDVMYCVADSNYTKIFLTDGSKLMVCKTLKAIESILCQPNFLRIHASNLINLNFIKRILKTQGYMVELPNHVLLDVSRSRRNELMLKLESL